MIVYLFPITHTSIESNVNKNRGRLNCLLLLFFFLKKTHTNFGIGDLGNKLQWSSCFDVLNIQTDNELRCIQTFNFQLMSNRI